MPTDRIEFDGTTYYQDSRGYYGAGGSDRKRGISWLHRDVWRKHNGEIPEGHHIHHVDGDPSNNDIDNLECLSPKEHASTHGDWGGFKDRAHAEKAREAAKEWHASEEGREWHRSHAKDVWKNAEGKQKDCEQCGQEFTHFTAARFCSNACKAQHRRESGVDDEERICEACQQSFTANKYSDTKSCSRRCAGALRSWAHRV